MLKDGPFEGVSTDGVVVSMCGSGRPPAPVDGEAGDGAAGDNNDDDDECEALDGSGDPFGGSASFAGGVGDIVVGII
jgi:hypothetical protein